MIKHKNKEISEKQVVLVHLCHLIVSHLEAMEEHIFLQYHTYFKWYE